MARLLFIYQNSQKSATTEELCSSGQPLLDVPRSPYNKLDDHARSVAAPKSWNNVPPKIPTTTAFDIFKSKLRTHLQHLKSPQQQKYEGVCVCVCVDCNCSPA